ncbi:unnamed protein product [Rotaria socialis]
MHRLKTWNFSTKDQKLVLSLLDEWYSGRTLNTVLEEWEQVGIASLRNQKEYIKILCYNVEGWGTRAVEAIDLAHEVQVSVCIFTEVGELWSTCRLPHFNKFYQKGTNKNGGVCIAVGKHLKATRIEVNIPNTVIIDITGLSEPVRIIGIYWPTSQQRDLDEIQPFVIESTILSGDFNATVKEWNSQITDRRGASVREWINENNLNYITSTTNTSKRSLRNIDLSFSNMSTISSETLCSGTSDHWPILLSCENISFDTNVFFPHTNRKIFEAVLALLQIFWMEEQKKNSADEWYKQYIRFIAAVKNRVTHWKERDKYKPSLPAYIIEKLKEIRKVRNRYYHLRHKGVFSEETRVLLRTMTRESKVDIAKHKNTQWQNFLFNIQTPYDKADKAFWAHLSRICKSRSLPFYKLSEGTKIISTHEGITNELFQYYSEQFKVPAVDSSNEHEDQIDRKVEKTSTTEITRIIKTLKPKKSAGFDSVSNFIIKKLPPSYIECLANCFNTWLNECRYPDDWKIAKIITLNKLKSGIPKCEQIRPISLLATHSKLFEKVLLLRIRHWAETNRLVPREQSGFRPKCLLLTRVLSIYQEVKNNMAANIPTLVLYVDYQKTYDRVWHAALLCKLEKMGMPLNLLKMTNSWLKERKAYVEYGEITSQIFSINIGLPQGSSLSPYLFIVFHSDLTNYLGAHSCHLFADDLCVLIKPPIMKKLGSMIDYLEKEGEAVNGYVVLTVDRPLKTKSIDVKLIGQRINTEVHGSGKHKHIVTRQRNFYVDFHPFVIQPAHGISYDQDGYYLEPNTYQWPFSLHLVKNLPPSLFRAKKKKITTWINYYVAVTVARSGLHRNVCEFVNITVAPFVGIPRHVSSVERVDENIRDLYIHGILLRNYLLIGEPYIPLELYIDNPGRTTIKEVIVKLVQLRDLGDKSSTEIIFEELLPGIEDFQNDHFYHTVQIPMLSATELFAPSTVYKYSATPSVVWTVNYALEMIFKTRLSFTNITLIFPLMVVNGSRPSHMLTSRHV